MMREMSVAKCGFSEKHPPLGQHFGVHSSEICRLTSNKLSCIRHNLSRFSMSMGGPGGSDSMQKIQRILGQANSEDRRSGFGPPPPEADAGTGLINLSGREDLLAGRRRFSEPSKATSAKLKSEAASNSNKEYTNIEEPVDFEEQSTEVSELKEGVEEVREVSRNERKPVLLPSPFTSEQRVIAIGMVVLTVAAYGKSSQDLLPESVLSFLQVWMRFAWGGHAGLGLVAAILASGKGQPPVKWFVKVFASGALGIQELLSL